jgi:hypothetical protein
MKYILSILIIALLFSGCYTQIIEDKPPQIPEIIRIDTVFVKSIPSSTMIRKTMGAEPITVPPGYEYNLTFTLHTVDSLGSIADNFYLSWSSPGEHNQGHLLTPWDIKRISKGRYKYSSNFEIRYKGTFTFFICKTSDLFKLKDDIQLEEYYLGKSIEVDFLR